MEIIYKHFTTLSSTNDAAKGLLKEVPLGVLLLVTADEQTAGRGQYGRHWVSPKGENIYATYAFLAEKNHNPLSLTHLLALSTVHALKEWNVECQIKWPNDLLVKGKKIAGILCETCQFATHTGILIGIGLNVNTSKEDLEKIGRPATSLYVETGEHHTPSYVLTEMTHQFSADLTLFLEKGFEPFQEAFHQILMH